MKAKIQHYEDNAVVQESVLENLFCDIVRSRNLDSKHEVGVDKCNKMWIYRKVAHISCKIKRAYAQLLEQLFAQCKLLKEIRINKNRIFYGHQLIHICEILAQNSCFRCFCNLYLVIMSIDIGLSGFIIMPLLLLQLIILFNAIWGNDYVNAVFATVQSLARCYRQSGRL